MSTANIRYLLLEKPLAHTPQESISRFDELIRSKKIFRLGYLFRFTQWGQQLIGDLKLGNNEIKSFSINWSFFAHHFLHKLKNWKLFTSSGGGAIRFYGVQIIALLAEIGYHDVLLSKVYGENPEELEKWVAVLAGSGLPECSLIINSKSYNNKFHVETMVYSKGKLMTKTYADLSDPFDSQANDCQPRKIRSSGSIIKSFSSFA